MSELTASVTAGSESTTNSATVATERHLWQIFTDENGDTQKQAVGIVKNPFESEVTVEPPGATNPLTTVTTGQAVTVVPHQTLAPPKPQRSTQVNGGVVGKNTKVKAGGSVVVFEPDKTYTKFDNVDSDQSEEDELGFPRQPNAEEHHPSARTLIRSDSDLMLPYMQGNHGNVLSRLRRWWTGRHIAVKAVIITLFMSLAYLFVVLIIIHTFS